MIIETLIFVNALVFCLLSGLHFYWVLGGKWALQGAIPEQFLEVYNSKPIKMRFATLIVALGLGSIAIVTVLNSQFLDLFLSKNIIKIVTAIVGIIFMLRAIGNFQYFGFFKTQKEGAFAKKDSEVYSPLCLFLGTTSLLIYLN